jgi:hypothetical protein
MTDPEPSLFFVVFIQIHPCLSLNKWFLVRKSFSFEGKKKKILKGIEIEPLRKVVSFVFHFNLLVYYFVVELFQKFLRKVRAVVDASIVVNKLTLGHLSVGWNIWVVRVRVQHNKGERQNVSNVCRSVFPPPQ